MLSHINLNKVGLRGQMLLKQRKYHWQYHVNLLIYEHIFRDWQRRLAIDATKTQPTVFSNFESIYLKHLKSLQSGQNNEPSISKNMSPHFSDSKSDQTFHVLSYVLGLYYVSYSMWWLSTYFEDGKVLESTVSWLLIESNQPENDYYWPPNTEREYITKFEILLWEVFWNSIEQSGKNHNFI